MISSYLHYVYSFVLEEMSYIVSLYFTIDRDDLKVEVALLKPCGISFSNVR